MWMNICNAFHDVWPCYKFAVRRIGLCSLIHNNYFIFYLLPKALWLHKQFFSLCIKILTSAVTFSAPVDDETDQPTLKECIKFQGKERRINIPQEIGVKYLDFGLFLLEDHNRQRTKSIAQKHVNDAEEINKEVLEKWTTGRGKHPVTWKMLTEVLHDIELSTLAGEIEAVKCHEDKANGNVGVSDGPVQRDQMTILTVEGSEQRSTRDISTVGMEDKHCETLQQRVNVAADLPSDSKHSKKKEKNQLARKCETAIDCEDSEENQENQMTSVPHGTGRTDTRPLQNEPLD